MNARYLQEKILCGYLNYLNNMKKIVFVLLIAAFAACQKFDCPVYTCAQQRILSYVSNSYFYRDNESGRVSISFYEANKVPQMERLFNGTKVLAYGEYNKIHYSGSPAFYCYQVSRDGRHLYSVSYMGSGRFDTIEIRILTDSTILFCNNLYKRK